MPQLSVLLMLVVRERTRSVVIPCTAPVGTASVMKAGALALVPFETFAYSLEAKKPS